MGTQRQRTGHRVARRLEGVDQLDAGGVPRRGPCSHDGRHLRELTGDDVLLDLCERACGAKQPLCGEGHLEQRLLGVRAGQVTGEHRGGVAEALGA